MSENNSGGIGGIQWPTLVIVALGIAAMWTAQRAPQSFRPPEFPVTTQPSGPELQSIPARMWQDPLDAARRACKANAEALKASEEGDSGVWKALTAGLARRKSEKQNAAGCDKDFESVFKSLFGTDAEPSSDPTLILTVCLNGGTTRDSNEGRLRSRSAVMSALATAEYAPRNDRGIGAFHLPRSATGIPKVDRKKPDSKSPAPPPSSTDSPEADGRQQDGKRAEQPPSSNGNPKEHDKQPDSNSSKQPNSREFDHRDALIPFEVFDYEGTSNAGADAGMPVFKHVVVFWLDSTYTDKNLLNVVFRLWDEARGKNSPRDANIWAATIGPVISTSLIDLFEEYYTSSYWRSHVGKFSDSQLQIYSPWATINVNRLLILVRRRIENIDKKKASGLDTGSDATQKTMLPGIPRPGKMNAKKWLRELARETNQFVRFERIGEDDKDLARLIISELELRSASPTNQKNHFAIISEWETHYSRALQPAYATIISRLVEKGEGTSNVGRYNARVNESLPQMHVFNYLSGLDGIPVGDDQSLRKAPNQSDDAEPESIGGSQIDSLIRLRDELLKRRALIRRSPGHDLKAIGVLGSDIYDRLLILQALRPAFPDVQFFITDLDARYLEERHYDYTRNLIVASRFGLSLAPQIQKNNAPFRESYQTGTYFSVLKALKYSGVAHSLESPRARIFEIARGDAYDLSTGSGADATAIDVDPSPASPRTESIARQVGLLLLAIGFGLLLIWLGSVEFQCWVKKNLPWRKANSTISSRQNVAPKRKRDRGRRWVTLAFLSLPLLTGVIAWYDHHSANGEPLLLLSGISVWPTNFIRAIIVTLSWILYLRGRNGLTSDQLYLREKYGVGGNEKDGAPAHARSFSSEGESSKKATDLRRMRLSRWQAQLKAALIRTWGMWDPSKVPPDRRIGGQIAGSISEVNDVKRPLRLQRFRIGYLWRQYSDRSREMDRSIRVLLGSVAFFLFAFLVFKILGRFPSMPTRGALSFAVTNTLLVLSVGALLGTTIFVLDATILCDRLLKQATSCRIHWSPGTLKAFYPTTRLNRRAKELLVTIRFLADHTETIGNLIYYPFVLFLLMLLARHPRFDNWDFPPGLVVVLTCVLGTAVIAAVMLRREAGNLKREITSELRTMTWEMSKSKSVDSRAEYERAINEVESIRRGAFGSVADNPVMRAILIPFGGLGTMQLIDYISRFYR